MIKKTILILILFILIFAEPTILSTSVKANDESIKDDLSTQVSEQLNSFDFSELDKILENYGVNSKTIFGASTFKDKLLNLISGTYTEDSTSIINAIVNILFEELLSILPLLCSIVTIVILCSFVSQLRASVGNKSVNDIVHFVCYCIVIIIVSKTVIDCINLTEQTLLSMKTQMDTIFPILLTLMTAIGNAVSVSVYQPAIALFSGVIMQIFTSIILPIFVICFIFTILSNLSNSVKLDNFISFFNSCIKWIIGITFTVFFGFLSIQGLSAASYDGITIRTAKYTIKSYIPILGSYLSEGFDLILASASLIKNALGATGLILLIANIIGPILKIIILMFGYKFVAAVLEPISDKRISSFIMSISKLLLLPIICILGVAFMYILTVALIICSGNIY